MAQRKSGHARMADELYPTPSWVVDCLEDAIDLTGRSVWEPCVGLGGMADAMTARGAKVRGTDIVDHGAGYGGRILDFTEAGIRDAGRAHAIITNPPYGSKGKLAERFIEKALWMMEEGWTPLRFVAFLLPVDFDSAITRRHLFEGSRFFARKITLLKRIKWFERGDTDRGPSVNHAWFVWEWLPKPYAQEPIITYAPRS